jgi:hypothetical protein
MKYKSKLAGRVVEDYPPKSTDAKNAQKKCASCDGKGGIRSLHVGSQEWGWVKCSACGGTGNDRKKTESALEIRIAELLLEDAPEEPVARALQRMDDAFKRGGLNGLVRATEIRLRATKERQKLIGMMHAIAQVIQSKRYGDEAGAMLGRVLIPLGDAAMAKAA